MDGTKPTEEQAKVLKRHGIVHANRWMIVQDLPKILIIKHRRLGDFRVLDK